MEDKDIKSKEANSLIDSYLDKILKGFFDPKGTSKEDEKCSTKKKQ
tara:strand:- start:222 stop:359 length:138 start_codon:yes stop_codon:yes gene_type:complete